MGLHFEKGRSIEDIFPNEDGSTFEVLALVHNTAY